MPLYYLLLGFEINNFDIQFSLGDGEGQGIESKNILEHQFHKYIFYLINQDDTIV